MPAHLFIDAVIYLIDADASIFVDVRWLGLGWIGLGWIGLGRIALDVVGLGWILFHSDVKIDFLKLNLLPNRVIENFWDALWLGIRPFLCLT